ncbi:MAG: hypothetical protein K2J31_07295, partial [Alistipes sp.]|nr:hypothetical protein [Alistipes sp.]
TAPPEIPEEFFIVSVRPERNIEHMLLQRTFTQQIDSMATVGTASFSLARASQAHSFWGGARSACSRNIFIKPRV